MVQLLHWHLYIFIVAHSNFTFQYGSIITRQSNYRLCQRLHFTFQYGSIITQKVVSLCSATVYFTFQYGSIITTRVTTTQATATLYIPIWFNYYCDKCGQKLDWSALHSNMVQLLLKVLNESERGQLLYIPIWFNYYGNITVAATLMGFFTFQYGSIITYCSYLSFLIRIPLYIPIWFNYYL